MEETKPKLNISIEGFDPLGLKAAGEISKEVVHLGVEGIKQFLNLTCKPLLEEIGFGLRDRWTNWRLLNVVNMLEKAQGKLQYDSEKEKLIIAPRVAFEIVEKASINENELLQDMWAGLFAASCRSNEEDENIMFIDILNRLTSPQVKLLNYLCLQCEKNINMQDLPSVKREGIITLGSVASKYEDLPSVMDTNSLLRIENELLSLESMGLIVLEGNVPKVLTLGQKMKSPSFRGLKPTSLSMLLYLRCQGSNDTPYDYFLSTITDYYYELVKDQMHVTKTDVLEIIFNMNQKGKLYEKELEFNSLDISKYRISIKQYVFTIKNADWELLPDEELFDRLRHYAIFRCITYIDHAIHLELKNKIIGTFKFNRGIHWGALESLI